MVRKSALGVAVVIVVAVLALRLTSQPKPGVAADPVLQRGAELLRADAPPAAGRAATESPFQREPLPPPPEVMDPASLHTGCRLKTRSARST